ncbi:UNVERIFIED_CONTAM: hypothetical protein Sradi_0859500 [Sesamum radiatum]|uniref:G-patch domain-containing protein n=1 Tax=Sesamum radiatum TaxID=300843 RepID=A0AAW2V248_SESRA
MQLARQGKISLEEDFTTKNAITIESGHVDGNKDSCNAMHGDDITNNEDTLFEKKDSSDVDDCMSIITFTDEDLLLGSKPHNRPLFVAGYVCEQKVNRILIDGDLLDINRLSHHSRDLCSQTQEKEGRHEALAIDEKGCDPKAFKLLIKTGYDPKEKLSLGKLPPEATDKKLHGLNATQIMLKEKGHAVQDSRVGLGFTPAKPICIAIKRVNSNYVSKGFSLTEDNKREENLREFVFNKLGPHRKELHRIANRQSVFDRSGPCKRVGHQKKCAFKGAVHLKNNIKSSHTQKLRSLIPSRMNRQITLTVSCGRVLKAKAQTVIFTQVQSDDEDDKKSVASSSYISNGVEEDNAQTYHINLIEDREVEEEDAEDAPAELDEGIKTIIVELKEVNLGDIENPRSIYISASLTQEEEGTYIALLHEFKDVFASSYKKMPGLDLKVAVHHLSVKK